MAVCRSKERQASPAHVTVDHAGRIAQRLRPLDDDRPTASTEVQFQPPFLRPSTSTVTTTIASARASSAHEFALTFRLRLPLQAPAIFKTLAIPQAPFLFARFRQTSDRSIRFGTPRSIRRPDLRSRLRRRRRSPSDRAPLR
ncbi:hypothetical protein NL676_000325 [Syzygium grande]|nr:hypothetical protein NL676_000325 [Syzygium grande]